MNTKLILFIATLMSLMSCNKDGFPSLPGDISIDADEDGIEDFELIYRKAEQILSATASQGVFCELHSKDDSEILFNRDEPSLFLRTFDEVTEDAESPLFWYRRSFIASKLKDVNEGWPSTWNISHIQEEDSYFIGIKIYKDNSIKVGWIEIMIDEESGFVSIEDIVLN